ncbi:response regulator transcription factor [Pseudomonas gozinkensis]|uniref:response regulator transcription factor n=1 Tax=Pseudomonas gozinkensis TaxID=2774461 RepID=UPI0017888B04|nr:response regulator transcription factor [Pseudomonas gozinkensis]
MKSVVIVDDHPVIRQALRLILESLGFKSIHEASSTVEVVPMIRQHRPTLLILDLKLEGGSGLDVLERIRSNGLECRVIVYTAQPPDNYLQRCMRAGARAYISKTDSLQQLINAVNAVMAGYTLFPEFLDCSVASLSNERQQIEHLSDRELHILVQLAHGKPNNQIAHDLNLSHKTISTYKTRLMLKLGLSSLVLLREFAKRNHLL